MPVQQSTAGATSGNLTQYEIEYMEGVLEKRTYDQLATPLGETFEPSGLTVARSWLTDALPRPTAAVGSETTDFEPQTLRDLQDTFNKVWLNDGIQAHDLVFEKSSLLKPENFARATGQLAIETIDALARRAGTEANLVYYGGTTSDTARANLARGTAGHRFGITNFTIANSVMGSFGTADGLFVIADAFQYGDLVEQSSAAIVDKAIYTSEALKMLLNYEVGRVENISILKSPSAKAFYAAGAANATPVSTTLATSTTANIAGATTIEVAANTNMSVGMWLAVGTVQTSTESDATLKTEIVKIASISATTITVVGKGRRQGLKYDHAVGDTVKNADTVHCAIFGRKDSMVVDWGSQGRFGKLVSLKKDGRAEQWSSWAFKYYGNYKVFEQGKLYRHETSASQQ